MPQFTLLFIVTALLTIVASATSTPFTNRRNSHVFNPFGSFGAGVNEDFEGEEAVFFFMNPLVKSTAEKDKDTLSNILRSDDRFSKLVHHLDSSSFGRGLRDDLDNPRLKRTVFAPTNEAFDALDRELPGGQKPDMEEILKYHVSLHRSWKMDDLYDGLLIPTQLKLASLHNKPQWIRVTHRFDKYYLNMYAEVLEQKDASNGNILVLNRVIIPPPDIYHGLYLLPTELSTFTSALQKIGLQDRVKKTPGLTAFVPTNTAWDTLGFRNLAYLFSDAGEKDLRKVVEYHLSSELVYSMDMEKGGKNKKGEKELEIKTWLRGETLRFKAHKQRKHGGHEGEKGKHRWNIIVNDEARVIFKDGVAENGVIHVVNDVLVPEGVNLPDSR